MGIIKNILEGKLKEAEEEIDSKLDSEKDKVVKEASVFIASTFLSGKPMVPAGDVNGNLILQNGV